jgi:hypothetical protein
MSPALQFTKHMYLYHKKITVYIFLYIAPGMTNPKTWNILIATEENIHVN